MLLSMIPSDTLYKYSVCTKPLSNNQRKSHDPSFLQYKTVQHHRFPTIDPGSTLLVLDPTSSRDLAQHQGSGSCAHWRPLTVGCRCGVTSPHRNTTQTYLLCAVRCRRCVSSFLDGLLAYMYVQRRIGLGY